MGLIWLVGELASMARPEKIAMVKKYLYYASTGSGGMREYRLEIAQQIMDDLWGHPGCLALQPDAWKRLRYISLGFDRDPNREGRM